MERDTDGVGYEVLDAGRGSSDVPEPATATPATPTTPSPPPDLVALDDLDLPPGAEAAGRRPAWWSALSGRRAPAVAIAAAALVAGALLGGWWSQQLQQQRADAARSSTLSAMAVVTGVDPNLDTVGAGSTSYADLTVQLFNAGPLPVDVVTTAPGQGPTSGEPLVRTLGGARTVPAGGTLVISVRIVVDCRADARQPGPLLLPVRTADGVVRWLAVNRDSVTTYVPVGLDACSQMSRRSSLLTQLAGTVTRPTLRLTNDTDRPLSVAVDVAQSALTSQGGSPVLRLVPPPPLVLAPRTTKELALQLTPRSCPRSLAGPGSSQQPPYIVLQVSSPGSPASAREEAGVDLSLAWGAALARKCS